MSRVVYRLIKNPEIIKFIIMLFILLLGIILFILLMIFLYWLYNKLILGKQIFAFTEKYQATMDKQKYLAAASVYCVDPYPTMVCLKSFYLRKQKYFNKQKEIFETAWGIEDHLTAVETLEWLVESGHRETYDLSQILAELHSGRITSSSLLQLIDDASAIESLNEKKEMRKIDKKAIYGCKGIAAWDFIRGANVARVCFNLGYISEKEAWEYLEIFSKQLKAQFKTWEDASFSFLLGRYLWSGEANQKEFVKKINYNFSYYKPDNKKGEINIWEKFVLAEM